MRLISFALTTAQVRAGTKTVTRRMGWLDLKAGEQLMACEKIMGRKKGEPLIQIRAIEVVGVLRERLRRMTDNLNYGLAECKLEGFPDLSPRSFVAFFCETHKGCDRNRYVTRIEFKYL